jgi:hypothetical protein
MRDRISFMAFALALAGIGTTVTGARALVDAKYPDFAKIAARLPAPRSAISMKSC